MNKLSFILSFYFAYSLTAQAIEQIKIIDTQFYKSGDSLHVSMRLETNQAIAPRSYSVTITPELSNQQNRLLLHAINVETRTSAILDSRNKNATTKLSKTFARGEEIAFAQTIPFASWMYDANIRLNIEVNGCCKTIQDPFVWIKEPVLSTSHITPAYTAASTLTPVYDEILYMFDFGHNNLIIDFKQSITTIDTTLFSNYQTLNLILNSIDSIQSSGDKMLSGIEITGYASPEGTTQTNKRLGEARALALKQYIKMHHPDLREMDFTLNNGAVNWPGLEKMVAASDMPHKKEVLDIIQNVPAEIDLQNNTSRKKQLMDLKGGVPYNYMYTHFFPKLRNACYISVYYKTVKDTNAEIINTAVELIQQNNYTDALNQLLPIGSDARTWNLIGVAYMMMKDFNQSKDYFLKAIAENDSNALKNLNQIQAFIIP